MNEERVFALVSVADSDEFHVLIRGGGTIGDGSIKADKLKQMVGATLLPEGWYEILDDGTATYVGDKLSDEHLWGTPA